MTEKSFFLAVSNGSSDIVQLLLDTLRRDGIDYCVIGGLAVNAYVEPVVSLDLDIVVVSSAMDRLKEALSTEGFHIMEFEHSVNFSLPGSSLRIQAQKDARYQNFLPRATMRDVLGYAMRVAAIEDVLQGKLWAYGDIQRRKSKRQKDLADILRLTESHPHVRTILPEEMREETP